MGARKVAPLQPATQHLHHLANRFLIAAVPAPLAALIRLHEPGLRQNRHVVRDGRLRKMNASFDVSGTQAGFRALLVFQCLQDAAAGGIGNRVQDAIER